MQPPNLTLSLRGPPGSRRTLRAAAAEDNKLVVAAEETLVAVTLEEDDEEEDALQEEEEDDDKEGGLVDSAALRLRFFGVGILGEWLVGSLYLTPTFLGPKKKNEISR